MLQNNYVWISKIDQAMMALILMDISVHEKSLLFKKAEKYQKEMMDILLSNEKDKPANKK